MGPELSREVGRAQRAGETRVPPRSGGIASDALRYREPRRAFPAWNALFFLIILAVPADVCRCPAVTCKGGFGTSCVRWGSRARSIPRPARWKP